MHLLLIDGSFVCLYHQWLRGYRSCAGEQHKQLRASCRAAAGSQRLFCTSPFAATTDHLCMFSWLAHQWLHFHRFVSPWVRGCSSFILSCIPASCTVLLLGSLAPAAFPSQACQLSSTVLLLAKVELLCFSYYRLVRPFLTVFCMPACCTVLLLASVEPAAYPRQACQLSSTLLLLARWSQQCFHHQVCHARE